MGVKQSEKETAQDNASKRTAPEAKQQDSREEAKKIEVGMVVAADQGDLGHEDVSKAKVTEIVHDQEGEVEKVVAEKGAIFKKELHIPVDRIRSVEKEPGSPESGAASQTVVIQASAQEVDSLSATGSEELPPANPETGPGDGGGDDVLDATGKALPTKGGMRRLEVEARQARLAEALESDRPPEETITATPAETGEAGSEGTDGEGSKHKFLHVLGPGLLSGMAGNDASAVASYSLDGAGNGYAHLWLMLLSTPLLQAVQYACAKIGRNQQKGLAEILREHYGRKVALPAALLLVVANTALIAADLVAISTGLELLIGFHWVVFAPAVALVLWYITVYHSFERIEKIFLVLSMIFVSYLITAFFCKPDWGEVLHSTLVPRENFGFGSVSTAVALLGATISPYTIFWQVQGEKEVKRFGSKRRKFKLAALDIAAGVVSGNLVAYFIIVSTAATLFKNHQKIVTALDAAKALEPLVGPYAKYLFALGLIGAGVIAIPVLLASASYGVAGTIGWPSSLSKKPWQNEGFYLILTFGLVVSLGLALLGTDPVHLMFWANVLQGVLSPALVVLLAVLGNSRGIMGNNKLGLVTNLGLGLGALVMFAASVLLFYGLATGG